MDGTLNIGSNDLALDDIGSEIDEYAIKLSKLSDKTQMLVLNLINQAYKLDSSDGTVKPECFEVEVRVKK